MKKLHTEETVDDVRKRLYTRGIKMEETPRHELSDTKIDVSRNWAVPEKQAKPGTTDLRSGLSVQAEQSSVDASEFKEDVLVPKKKRHYRTFVLIGSLLILVFVAVASSLYMYIGGNQISGNNINVAIKGPVSIGGGEEFSAQVLVANQNSVPMDSVVLVVKYPEGSQSVGLPARNLREDRIPIDGLEPGEVRNVPVNFVIFGEENVTKIFSAAVEYRVEGSNGTFIKDVEPLSIRITSSPLVLRVNSIEKVASGQMVDVELVAISNASSPLYDVLVTASYPDSFSFESSEPAPVFGQGVWKIDELLPEETYVIKLRGVMKGYVDDSFRLRFVAGPTQEGDPYVVASPLAESYADFLIERPFIDVAISANGKNTNPVIISEGEAGRISAQIKNTLDETVYDMRVELLLGGNVIGPNSIETVRNASHDTQKNSVVWDEVDNTALERILPGDSRSFSVVVKPTPVKSTASYEVTVNVFARRISEVDAQEVLIGTTKRVVKINSAVDLSSQVGRNVGRFGDSGPVPPEVGETTTYTATVVATAGVNDLAGTLVNFDLPGYVDWLDQYEAEGEVIFNKITKDIEWRVGDMAALERKELTFQVAIQPNLALRGKTPVLVNRQYLKTKDRFTELSLQDTASAVTTELSTEMGFPVGNGEIVE